MNAKFLLTATIISSAISVSLLIYVFTLPHNKGWYSDEYHMHLEPAQNYIKRIISPNFSPLAVEDLNKLSIAYNELAVMYEMYMADFRSEPDACRLFYQTIEQFYNAIGEDIPQLTFEYAFSLLKKGAEYKAYEDEFACLTEQSIRWCCGYLSDIYNEGKYVPRDTSLAKYYKQLCLE